MLHSDWFHEARYGMFLHWGAYAVAARGEWVLNRERIPFDEYVGKYVNHFTAERYDPDAWADLAVRSGMRYMILTTRHHDGFALWDTDTTDYNAAKMGPKRDLLAPYVEAVRAAGLKVGFYFSVADWRHPDYPDAYARDWPGEGDWASEEARCRFVDFYKAQLEELMTRYGTIDVLWYDGCIPGPLEGASANRRVRELQPGILINERNGKPFDLAVSEQSLTAKEGMWEACMTLNGNWGYHAGDNDWKSARDVIRMLVTTASKGGNLLMNVGPRGDGSIPEPSAEILTAAGEWLERNREFLPNSRRTEFAWNNSSELTARGNTVYVHLFYSPGTEYCLAEIANKVLAARYVDGGEPVDFEQKPDGRLILKDLPQPLPDPIATTIALEVEGEPRPLRKQTTFWIPD